MSHQHHFSNPGPMGEEEIASSVAVAGHPIHAMSVHFPIALAFATLGADVFYWWSGDPFWHRAALWSAGFAFLTGIVAAVAGTAELVLVAQIRRRVPSWTHAIAAMMLLAIMGMNWGMRAVHEELALSHALYLSALAAIFTGFAGWHGGKLIFHHGVGVIVSTEDEDGASSSG